MDVPLLPPAGLSGSSAAIAGPSGAPGAGAGAAPRTKSKAYQTTIAAEADDLKYESKYKELKKKVREVEEDNEQLYVKILQAQQSIQRLRLERAIIYERLASIPPPTSAGAGGHPSQDNNPSSAAHPPPSNNNAPPGSGIGPSPSSGGGGSTPHHPHPLSQSFTPTSHSHSHSHPSSITNTYTGPPPTSSNPPRHHPTPLSVPAPPSSSAHPHTQYSPTQTSPLASTKRGGPMDVDIEGHTVAYGKHAHGNASKGRVVYDERDDERDRAAAAAVHNGHAHAHVQGNGVVLPPISPGTGSARGHSTKSEGW